MEASASVPASSAPKLGRRTYVIDRGFQLKYTLMLVVVGALISSLFGGMMYLAHLDAQRAMNPPPGLRDALARADSTLVWLMVAITVLMAVAFGLFGILITHRVAGPVFVMSHYVGILAKGRYPMMRPLRKQDELKRFFERFQAAIEALRTREATEAEELSKVVAQFEGLAHTAEAKAAVEALRGMAVRKRDATDRVDVKGTGSIAA